MCVCVFIYLFVCSFVYIRPLPLQRKRKAGSCPEGPVSGPSPLCNYSVTGSSAKESQEKAPRIRSQSHVKGSEEERSGTLCGRDIMNILPNRQKTGIRLSTAFPAGTRSNSHPVMVLSVPDYLRYMKIFSVSLSEKYQLMRHISLSFICLCQQGRRKPS